MNLEKGVRIIIPDERIIKRIFLLREQKLMLDLHLAELYGVETRILKQAVRRNLDRFPADFMFLLNRSEIDLVIRHHTHLERKQLGGAKPFAFTEAGVAMLSSVLNSEKAIQMNVIIIRTFTALRKLSLDYKELRLELDQLKNDYKNKFKEIYTALDHLINPHEEYLLPRKRIGFKQDALN